jgi:RNA recognition motif-containing protein
MQGSKLYVGNLNYSATEEELTTLFADYGNVRSVKVIEGRGFAFVEMSEPEEAESAKEGLNEALFQGRKLKVDEAHAPKRRDYGGGHGGSRRDARSGSRGRGNSRGGRNSRGGGNYRRDY